MAVNPATFPSYEELTRMAGDYMEALGDDPQKAMAKNNDFYSNFFQNQNMLFQNANGESKATNIPNNNNIPPHMHPNTSPTTSHHNSNHNSNHPPAAPFPPMNNNNNNNTNNSMNGNKIMFDAFPTGMTSYPTMMPPAMNLPAPLPYSNVYNPMQMVNYGATPTVNPSAFMQLAAMNAMMANMLAAQTSLTPGAPPSYPPPAAAGAPFSFPAMPAVSPAPVNKPVLHPNGGALDTAAEKTAKKEQILAEKVAIEMANIRKIFRKQGREGAPTVNVYDPTFHYIYEVPTAAVTHLPPAKLNITRLVLCRSYHPSEPHRCLQQHLCKFVHVDCDLTTVPAQPIHVNYTYRALANCTYSRLPEGEVLEIPSESGKEEMTAMPSDHLLITRGSVWWYRKLHPEYTAVVDDKVFEVKTPETPAPSRRCVNYDHGCVCSDGHHCAYLHFITVDDTLSAPFRRKIQASAATYEEMNKPAEEEGEKDTAPPLEHVWLRAAKADVMGDSPEGTYFYLPPGGMTLTKVDKSAVVGEIPGAEESGGVSEASQQS